MNHVVIMAGGIGSRFWPLSTPEFPKQFIDILGCGRTLIQLTVDRFRGSCGGNGPALCPDANFWVVTNAKYVDIVREQIPTIPAEHILAEPAARNTAPCIAWAAWCIRQEDPSANIVVTPSDAVVMNPAEFQRVIGNALEFTSPVAACSGCPCDTNPSSGRIVTIGIKPNRPETGYGYVQEGAPVVAAPEGRQPASGEICKVQAFKEKPDLETAKAYLAAGNYLWNAGIFVLNVETITSALRKYKPQIASVMDAMVDGKASDVAAPVVGESSGERVGRLFPLCEKVSIDYAVMEPAAAEGLVYTHPADFGWSDLGNWQSLHEKLQKDASDNAVVGNVRLFECRGCVVHTEDARKVVLQGLDGYIVSSKNGQLLICRRSEEQRIKQFSSEI